MIELKDVSFSYSGTEKVLDKINLSLGTGIHGLIGCNGAGKSTLIKIITGLIEADGTCFVKGEASFARSVEFLKSISLLSEEPYAPDCSVIEYSDAIRPFYDSFDSKMFDNILTKFDVDKKKSMHKMSLGQRKKALMAIALAKNTSILILDEPTNGLDIPSKSLFREVISDFVAQRKTIIISTHQIRDIWEILTDVVMINNHNVVVNSSTKNIADKLSFSSVESIQSDALYSERNAQGYYVVTANTSGTPSHVDLELLFNAVIAKPEIAGLL